MVPDGGGSPWPFGRGPIEALRPSKSFSVVMFSPWPFGRGPIEAPHVPSVVLRSKHALHGLLAVAPLKRLCHPHVARNCCNSPWPFGRGPIEATSCRAMSLGIMVSLHGLLAVAPLKPSL